MWPAVLTQRGVNLLLVGELAQRFLLMLVLAHGRPNSDAALDRQMAQLGCGIHTSAFVLANTPARSPQTLFLLLLIKKRSYRIKVS